MTIETSRALWQSAMNILKSSRELTALMDELSELLIDEWSTRGKAEATNTDGEGSDWILTSSSFHVLLKQRNGDRGRYSNFGTVTVSVQLCPSTEEEDLMAWPGAGVARLMVGWAPTAKSCDPWESTDFEAESPSVRKHLMNEGGWLWRYVDDAAKYDAWFFGLPLAALQDGIDLKHQVAKPLMALLEGAKQEDAFPSDSAAFRM